MSDATTVKIRNALQTLDHSSDQDWTAMGLPAVDAVSNLVGRSVTRRQIELAAPGYTRASSSLPTPGAVPAPNDPAPADQENDDEEGEDEGGSGEGDEAPGDGEADDGGDAESEGLRRARAAVDELRRERAPIAKRIEEGAAELRALDDRLQGAEAELTRYARPIDQAAEMQRLLKRGQERRERRARETAEQITKPSRSRLDQAMGWRRGFGMRRPRFPAPPRQEGTP